MSSRAAITVLRSREEVQRLWQSSEYRPEYIEGADAAVTFADAPGDRGTEIHVDLAGKSKVKLGGAVQKLAGSKRRAKVMDDLRRQLGVRYAADGSDPPSGEGTRGRHG